MKLKYVALCIIFLFSIFSLAQPPNGSPSLTPSDVDLELTDAGVMVSVDFSPGKSDLPPMGDLTVTLLNDKFEPVESVSKRVVLLSDPQRERILFTEKIDPSDLRLYSVDVEFGGNTVHKRVTRRTERQDIVLLDQFSAISMVSL